MLKILKHISDKCILKHSIQKSNIIFNVVSRKFTNHIHSFDYKQKINSKKMASQGILLRFNLTKEDIPLKTKDLISSSKVIYDSVGALKTSDVTFENTIKVLADHESTSSVKRNCIDFLQHVSTDKELRELSAQADKEISDFEVEMSMREDVFKNILQVDKLERTWKPEQRRLVERLIKIGRRNGLHLPEATRDQIKTIKKRISELGIDFSRNLNEEKTVLEFTAEQLVGLPESFMKDFDKTDAGLYKVTLKYPDYFPCQKFVRNPETRAKLEAAFNSRCIDDNTKILEELITIRKKKAELLGYKSHADLILEMRMAKDKKTVATFLSELTEKLQPLKTKETASFLAYKEAEHKKYDYPFDGKLVMSDYRYYMTRIEEKEYSVDQLAIKEYFPLNTVTTGLLNIYQNLLGVIFTKIEDPEIWHKDVSLYRVDDSKTKELMGYFYLDIFPREGKYGHAACFGLQPGCMDADGGRQISVAAMVANFSKPSEQKPSLLAHDEVETYFHEFGHVMHQICSTTDYAMFSGTSVERDFVEAPSQMLENWAWHEESLRLMSSHYQTAKPIPSNLLDSLLKSRQANAGLFNLRQILLGTFDQQIHSSSEDKIDTAALYSKLSKQLLGIEATKGTNMAASFGHLAGGYDAQYYGYMWSQVFSDDMFLTRFSENVLSSTAGASYRECILSPGGSKDATEMVKNFLGREPNQEAFLKMKGLSSS